jgi:hypothetical protein
MSEQAQKNAAEASAQLKAAQQASRQAAREAAELYGKRLPSLSHRQLCSELKRTIRQERNGKNQFNPGLTIAFATVLSTVLENTNTPTNPFGRLAPYLR